MLVYQDVNFVIPSPADISNLLSQIQDELDKILSLINTWNNLVDQYFAAGGVDPVPNGVQKRINPLDLVPQFRAARLAILAEEVTWSEYTSIVALLDLEY